MAKRLRHWFLISIFVGSSPTVPVFGKMAEWLKAIDCKSIGCKFFVGSNPARPIK